MLADRVSNPGPLTYKSGALPIALRCPADYVIMSGILFLILQIFPSWPCGCKTYRSYLAIRRVFGPRMTSND